MGSFFKRRDEKKRPFCSVVVAAGGSSSRMEGQDKMLALLDGVPVLLRTLLTLDSCPSVSEVVVAARRDQIAELGTLCKNFGMQKVTKLVAGGDTRTRSVLRGVLECSKKAQVIAIHDGARPLVSQRLLEDVIGEGLRTGAAAPAVPVKDTVKQAENGVVTATPDRNTLFAVQTPQVFDAALIRAALTQAEKEGVTLTDDCAAVERLGMKVTLTRGEYENIKITTPEDLILGEAILAWRETR